MLNADITNELINILSVQDPQFWTLGYAQRVGETDNHILYTVSYKAIMDGKIIQKNTAIFLPK